MTRIIAFVDEGLGHSSYLVDLGEGRSLVIDPPRFADEQRAYAAAERLAIAFTADTHTHADYVSGSPQLAASGATFLAPAAAELEVPHTPMRDGDTTAMGRYALRALATAGHTPDHLAYLLLDDDRPVALFSGGSLMVGTAGRTDLSGPERTEELAHAQYHSLHDRVMTLPDDLVVYPTHGRGSFCSAPGATQRTTTIGHERATNPLLQLDEEDFVEQLVAGFGTLPTYFRRLPEVNRRGPRLYDTVPALTRLSASDVEQHIANRGIIIDTRPFADFAVAHIVGSISNTLRSGFATWLAVAIPGNSELVFVVDDIADERDAVRQALNVGHEHLIGVLDGGINAWQRAGNGIATIDLVTADRLDGYIIDVRQRDEYDTGHVPNAYNVELGSVTDAPITGSVTLMCGHGERAMTAASLLARTGNRDVRVLDGGPGDWARTHGTALERAL
jgi:hydroxyacylglutathione hydrolase